MAVCFFLMMGEEWPMGGGGGPWGVLWWWMGLNDMVYGGGEGILGIVGLLMGTGGWGGMAANGEKWIAGS